MLTDPISALPVTSPSIPYCAHSGKITIETTFLDGKTMLFKTLVRIFYD